jgi:hypothetical protein
MRYKLDEAMALQQFKQAGLQPSDDRCAGQKAGEFRAIVSDLRVQLRATERV